MLLKKMPALQLLTNGGGENGLRPETKQQNPIKLILLKQSP